MRLIERLRHRIHDSNMDNECMLDDAIAALEAADKMARALDKQLAPWGWKETSDQPNVRKLCKAIEEYRKAVI